MPFDIIWGQVRHDASGGGAEEIRSLDSTAPWHEQSAYSSGHSISSGSL